jgi:TolB-like protein/Tfp pilus assembly protein PilF
VAQGRAFVHRGIGDRSEGSREAVTTIATRRLAAILAADVAGYSRLMGAEEEGTNAEVPEDKRIIFRIGVNLGDVIADSDDIYGDGVNIAARLEALAEPGGICISRTVRDHIGDRLPYTFEDIGEQSVKNIAQPVHAYAMSPAALASTPLVAVPAQISPAQRGISPQRAVIAASVIAVIGIGVAAWWAWPRVNSPVISVQAPVAASPPSPPAAGAKSAPRLSIVVLPFANLSNDPDQEYFTDGITDDLTTDLSRISGSFVIARNTAFTYKGKPVDARQVGRELGVRYVLEGSVRRAGDQVRVNAQLIDAENGAHLWADRFDTDRANLPEAQNQITSRLARTLNVELVRDASRRIEQEKAVDPDARDLVMRGWALSYRPVSAANQQEALSMFERALELDPRSIDARIGIARVLVSNVGSGLSNSVEQDNARAGRLLVEALDSDPTRQMAHSVMGQLRRHQNRVPESRLQLETAVALDPNNDWAHSQLGWTLLHLGEPNAAIAQAKMAMRLNPLNPTIWGAYALLGWCYLLSNNVDQAVDWLVKARAANPRIWWLHYALAGALGLKGDLDGAKSSLADLQKIKPEVNSIANFYVYLPFTTYPTFRAQIEKTIHEGLRHVGFPET